MIAVWYSIDILSYQWLFCSRVGEEGFCG